MSSAEKLMSSQLDIAELSIGSWKRNSSCAGQLVAHFYFFWRQLNWEVWNTSSKNKFQFSWDVIDKLKVAEDYTYLEIQLFKPPIFNEWESSTSNKGKWTVTQDFTSGVAVKNLTHRLKFAPGVLRSEMEKLFRSDPRLSALARDPSTLATIQNHTSHDPSTLACNQPRTSKGPSTFAGSHCQTSSDPSTLACGQQLTSLGPSTMATTQNQTSSIPSNLARTQPQTSTVPLTLASIQPQTSTVPVTLASIQHAASQGPSTLAITSFPSTSQAEHHFLRAVRTSEDGQRVEMRVVDLITLIENARAGTQ